jgi:hypothetical protein
MHLWLFGHLLAPYRVRCLLRARKRCDASSPLGARLQRSHPRRPGSHPEFEARFFSNSSRIAGRGSLSLRIKGASSHVDIGFEGVSRSRREARRFHVVSEVGLSGSPDGKENQESLICSALIEIRARSNVQVCAVDGILRILVNPEPPLPLFALRWVKEITTGAAVDCQ